MSDDGVGRVLGSEHSSTAAFRVVLDDDDFLQLDDLVVVRTQVPKAGEVKTYGVVTEAEAVYEGATYESDTHRVAELGIMPAAKVRTARVAVTRVDPEVWVSPDPGEIVERATGEERAKALYVDEMGRPLAIGIGRDGDPVCVDLDFFDGRKGGHMSISGISGVATKTSFALFFLRMLTANPRTLGEGAANLRVLVFNVKGEDLLWLDKPNKHFDDEAAAGWATLGVEPGPFPSVRFWAPPRQRSGDVIVPDTGGRLEGVDAFAWTPREFVDEDLLQFCFTDANDTRNQLPFIRERVQAQLKRFAVDVEGNPGAIVLRDPRGSPDGTWRGLTVGPQAGERIVTDLGSLVDALEEFLEPETGDEPDLAWSGRVQAGTVSAFMRRLHAAAGRMNHLVRAGESRRIDRTAASVTVVAIQSLHEQAQRFVVGALLNEAFHEKEQTGQRLPLSVVVLDELNKYAPRDGSGPLKDMLVDIAQRGRSLGILLVGAQQTASRVASEVLENAAIRASGRLDAAEAERAEYGWMLPSTRARARLLKPGTMVISQPAIPVPLVVTFPFPPWATRKEEVATDAGDDPFAGL
ncbi:MAG TPA: ATP-binding protein [Actinomycetota bacterium]